MPSLIQNQGEKYTHTWKLKESVNECGIIVSQKSRIKVMVQTKDVKDSINVFLYDASNKTMLIA
jgi:hypothetical protein